MKKATKCIISIMLTVVCMFSYTLRDTAYALSNELQHRAHIRNIAGEIAEEPSEILPDSPLLYEDVSGREENIKRFVREDRAVEAVIYPYPVHYEENGEWKDIDNRLTLQTRADGTQVYTNQEGTYQVSFATNANSEELVKVEKDGYTISWRLSDRSASASAQIVTPENAAAAQNASTAADMRELPNLSSVITYADALSGTDISYVVGPTGVRELVTIESAAKLAEDYTMEVTCAGLTPTVAGNEIKFMDASDDEVFKIGAPFVMDAAGEATSEVALQLVPVAELQMLEEMQSSFTVQLQPSGGISVEGGMPEPDTAEIPVPGIEGTPELPGNEEPLTPPEAAESPAPEEPPEAPAGPETTGEPEPNPETEPTPEITSEPVPELTPESGSESEPPATGEGLANRRTAGTVLLSGTGSETAKEEHDTEVPAGQPNEEEAGSAVLAGAEGTGAAASESETSGIWAEEGPEATEPALPEAQLQALQELQAQLEAGAAIDRISGMEAADGTVAFTYTMIPSRAWLEAPEREFPVTIDPDVQTSLDSSQVHDTFISSLDPNENTYLFSKLKVGYGESSGINRIYIKFPNLPALGAGDMVIKASLNIARRNSNSSNDLRLDVHRVTEDWTSSTLVWNNRAAYDTTKVESISYSVLPGSFNTWDITGLVKQWYDGTPNYGCVIKAYDETWGYMEYHSVDAQYYYSSHPYASIVYVNATGLEDTWTYHSQSVGRAGTVSVNDYNGNLVLTHSDVSIASGVMPITLNHVFNTHDKDVDLGYGYGWRLNYAQTAVPVTISGTNYYKHIDGDGTAHYYRQSASSATLYENELDKETTLTVSGSTKTIQDKLGNQLIFNSAGQLCQLKDSNGNALNVNYNSSGQVSSIVDGASRTTTLSYSGGRLAGIDAPDGLDVSYAYDSAGRLTGITYADNKSSAYSYDANGNLTAAENYDGYKVQYGYTNAAPYRVISISEYAGSTAGGSLAISHGWNSTTFTDNQDRKSIYQFNNHGQTVAIRDVDGSAQYCAFNDGDRTVTQLKTVSKLQKTSINLLANHNMESSASWTMGTGASYSTADQFMGSKSLKLSGANAAASQAVTLTPGKTYTLSAYFKGVDGARLSAAYGGTTVESTGVSSAALTWQRESLTFTLPASASSSVTVQVKLPGTVSGTAYADCVMLEQADAMNRYNLLENGDLDSASGWTRGSGLTASDALVTVSGSLHPEALTGSAYKLIGSSTADKAVSQTIPVSGSTGDCYTFGGWAQMNTIPAFTKNAGTSTEVNYGQRKLRLGFVGASGTQYYEVSFNPDSTEWQYICGAAVAPFDYSSIVFSFEYNFNCNEAYFDGMQVFREEFCESYTYDSDGNVVSVQGLAEQNNAFEYNGTNDLVKATDAKGNKFNYTYDNKHNLLTATSDSGMKYTFTYDSRGNALTSRVGSDTEYIETSATYTDVGSFTASMTDARGKSVSYGYDTNKGLRTSVTDAKNNTSTYSYDSMNRLSGLTQGEAAVGYTYTNDDLTGISHNGFTYGMTYDLFGHTLATKVNSTALSENTYDNSRSLLTRTEYGNGLTIHYTYDVLDRVTEVKFGSTLMYSYSYDGEGNLQRMVDHQRDVTTVYYYDLTGRLIRSASDNGSEYQYEYDLNNNLTKLRQSAGGSSWTTEYTYDKDNRPLTAKVNGKTITDSYNATGTRASRVYGFSTPYTVALTYLAGANGSKTGMLQSYRNGSEAAYTYAYDDNGNVTSITKGSASASYTYDALNQLTRVNDGFTNKTTTYTYDNAGNILERKEYAYTTGALGTPVDTVTYAYDSTWKDKLVSYDGEAITYDEIGNPLSYRGYTMAWEGKRLQSLSGNSTTASYTYDEQGVRSSKTVNGVTTTFSYNGSLLMAQVQGSGSNQVKQLYSYNANGDVISVNYNGTEYYYLRNGQTDIVGLMDGSGTKVVEYTYDAWGKLISTTGTLATSLGADNPFRYRGYYYDTETGLYYLMTRYYDPEVCRFISADVYMTTGQGVLGGNMWAYCGNNPVRRVEVLGQSWEDIWELFGSLFGAGGETVAEKSITKEYNYIVISFEVSDSVSHSEPFGKTDAQIVFFSNNTNGKRSDFGVSINAFETSASAYVFSSADSLSVGTGISVGAGSKSYSAELDVSLKNLSVGLTGSRSHETEKKKRYTKSASVRVNLIPVAMIIGAVYGASGIGRPAPAIGSSIMIK